MDPKDLLGEADRFDYACRYCWKRQWVTV